MKGTVLTAAAVAVLSSLVMPALGSRSAAAAPDAAPALIPALREWAGADGRFELTPSTSITFTSPALAAVAETLADDLETLTGHRPRVDGTPAPGGIVLRLDDVGLPTDGHIVDIATDTLTVSAPTDTGVFLGTRTILQLTTISPSLPTGTARDWPRYPERGLMVDIGRKYHSADWLEQHIRDLAYLKMNLLHLHLSDDLGFRIESETHPEIVSAEHLTKAEIRHLLAVAERYHVTVVPEIDMPGHMTQILATHPDLQLRDGLGQRNPTALDVTNPDARAFAGEIIEEYLDLFPGPYWHGGADEYLHPLNQPAAPAEPAYPLYPDLLVYARAEHGPTANHKDAYLDFVNWMDDLVASHGRTLRIWADGLHGGSAVTVHADIPVEWWQFNARTAPASGLLAAGHPVVNAGWNPTYQSAAFYAEWTGQGKNELYWDQWDVHEFWGIEDATSDGLTAPRDQVSPDEPRNLGSKVHLWYDEPDTVTIEESAVRVCPKLRLIAQKTWESPTAATWTEFLATSRLVGRGPGFTIDGSGACASPRSVDLAAARTGPVAASTSSDEVGASSPGAGSLAATGDDSRRLGAAGTMVALALGTVARCRRQRRLR